MILEPKKKYLSLLPLLPWSDGTRCHDLNFLNAGFVCFFYCCVLSQLFHSPLSPSSRVSLIPLLFDIISCLSLLIFLQAILFPACDLSSPAFCMMYSVYKLSKQGDNIQPCCIPFPILNQSVDPCKFLAVASWPTYRFLRRQVR